MQTENEIFTKYLKEKFNEVDLELNAPLRDTADFNSYMLNIRLKELGDEFVSSLKRKVCEILRPERKK